MSGDNNQNYIACEHANIALPCVRPATLRWEPIARHIERGSILHTDGARTYAKGVEGHEYYHDAVNHSAFQWTAFSKCACGGGYFV